MSDSDQAKLSARLMFKLLMGCLFSCGGLFALVWAGVDQARWLALPIILVGVILLAITLVARATGRLTNDIS